MHSLSTLVADNFRALPNSVAITATQRAPQFTHFDGRMSLSIIGRVYISGLLIFFLFWKSLSEYIRSSLVTVALVVVWPAWECDSNLFVVDRCSRFLVSISLSSPCVCVCVANRTGGRNRAFVCSTKYLFCSFLVLVSASLSRVYIVTTLICVIGLHNIVLNRFSVWNSRYDSGVTTVIASTRIFGLLVIFFFFSLFSN